MARAEIQSNSDLFSGNLQSFSHTLGGLEFYGRSREFHKLMSVCSEMASPEQDAAGAQRKAYVFLPPSHGKSSLARAVARQAAENGVSASCLDGVAGITVKELNALRTQRNTLAVVDGLPETQDQRSKLLERFNTLAGCGILFAGPEYAADANLDPTFPFFSLPHVDERYPDKLAWILGLILESLRDDSGTVPEEFRRAVKLLGQGAFPTFCKCPLGTRTSSIGTLAERLAEAIRLAVTVGNQPTVSQDDVIVTFTRFLSPVVANADIGYRLWVEGDTDRRLLDLVCRLVSTVHQINLVEGLSIRPLGAGRDGGTSKAMEIVIREQTRKNRDIFLLDCDEPGRHAERDLRTLEQDVLLLDVDLACSQAGGDIEIEDLISVGCLDRFYTDHPELRPEKEIIRYKPPMSRRLVVNGVDKDLLVDWLESNAKLEELENILFMLCEVRSRFSLRTLPEMKDRRNWKRRLIESAPPEKCLGKRCSHW